ncbi:hypothetical protein ACFOTA_16495 [Chitinophaga sp. GCM10012297]|uniref:Gluconate 2-dehydrogenase subunit 3-like protein n=1 Tax=Chitinophaga chungangae TaxID=2821488 RepID=A0ABS3YGL8_9BACT|nr:hypothetical protein [Chitinophaga chungangae]MBO9153821.1 hypothetical protein [Chitinophaga chungangae]
MIRSRLYITLICCGLYTGTQACHNSRPPQGSSAVAEKSPQSAVAAVQMSATDSSGGTQSSANTAIAQSSATGTPSPPGSGQPAPGSATSSTSSVTPATQSVSPVKLPSTDPDEQQFRSFFTAFQKAVQQNNPGQLVNLLYFPLQTAQQWTNQDLKDMNIDRESGKVSRQEFNSYRENIFNRDVLRLLPKARENQLSEIDASSPEDYYKALRKCTDKASKMYEVYMQYPETNGNAENYFAFVFGRVKGRYKVIGYYAKWPVKG